MRPVEFYAYHGTSLNKAKEIIQTKVWEPKKMREDHWLGHGSYFFREDFEQAKSWAYSRYNRDYKKGKDSPSVIETKIEVNGEKILNLDTREGIKFLESHIESLIKQKGILIEGKEDILRSPAIACFVFSVINKDLKWVILKTFPVYSKHYSNNPYLEKLSFEHQGKHISYELSGTQVCVRNNQAIKEMSIKFPIGEKTLSNVSMGSVRRERLSSELFGKQ